MGSVSRIQRWAARSWVCQPSHSVGASGPTSSRRSHRAARSDLANVTSDHASPRALRTRAAAERGQRSAPAPRAGENGRVQTSELDPGIAARLKRDSRGLITAVDPAGGHRRGVDGRLDERPGPAPDPDLGTVDVLLPEPEPCGSRGRPAGTANGSARSGWTATATRCWSPWIRRVPPATPGPGPVSTTACSRPSSPTVRSRRRGSRSDRAQPGRLPGRRSRSAGHPGLSTVSRRRRIRHRPVPETGPESAGQLPAGVRRAGRVVAILLHRGARGGGPDRGRRGGVLVGAAARRTSGGW